MAPANRPVVQSTPQGATAGVVQVVAPVNAPARLAEAQPLAAVVPGVAQHPQNIVPPNHPNAQIIVGPAGTTIPVAAPGASPLHRSLYGRRLGN
ncbi:unnamed protein product [Rhizoctonia solani]|uniref:Uncharacterized protein n=1 Tax=Rhizoctonia solani TaxID=456999 RepID=A0A8H3AAR2_9AGAM|nr:unnamed protein product [Rhizoctonia solani]